MRNFFIYSLFLILTLSFIGAMGLSSIVKYHYDGGKKFQFLQKTAILIASTPNYFKYIIKHKTLNPNKLFSLKKHKDKKQFEQFIKNERNNLLVASRYDVNLKRSIVDIIDLKNFKTIHTYKHDIKKMNDQVLNSEIYSNINLNQIPIKFRYFNPIILEDGSLISHNYEGPLFKIDFCSNLLWINDKKKFHHMQNKDYEENVWVGSYMNPQSENIKKYSLKNYKEDSITKINSEGKILFDKSVNQILIENNILPENFVFNLYKKLKNPFHLNDIEPAFTDTDYWLRDDLLISLRNLSAIVHYRPSTNKVINYITGPFAEQHDVDIISDKEISIFNNNNFLVNNKYSEILIYNFETKTFKKLFNDQLRKENFKTKTNGVSQILKDKSLFVEESVHGRILLFNNKGEKEWEYVNKDKDGNIGLLSFSLVIENELFIEKFKLLIKNKKCLN